MPSAGGNKGILGSIAGIFDKGPKIKERPYSQVLKGLLNKDLANESRANIAKRQVEQDSFAQKLKEAEPLALELQGERLGFLRNLTKSAANYDPMQAFTGLGDYLFGKANALAPAALDIGRRSANDAAIALGLSPGASSGVVERVRMGGINDLLARTYGDTTRALVPSFGLLTGSRESERSAVQNLLERMAIEPDRFAARELLPSMARTAGQQADIANVQDLINAYVSNTAGYTSSPSTWGRISEGLGGVYGSVLESAQTAADIYGSLAGAGAFGGGGAKPAAKTNTGSLSGLMSMLGGGGGTSGGGMSGGNIASLLPIIMQILQALQGGGGGGGGTSGYDQGGSDFYRTFSGGGGNAGIGPTISGAPLSGTTYGY